MGPDLAERCYGLFNYGTSIVLDAENAVTGNVAHFGGGDAVLAREVEDAIELCRCDRDYRAGAAFTKKEGFGGSVALQGHPRTQFRRCETGFGESDGQAAIAEVVGGLNGFRRGEGEQTLLQAFFGREIDGWRLAGDDACDGFGIFGRRKFAG